MLTFRKFFNTFLLTAVIVGFGCKKKTDTTVTLTGTWNVRSTLDGANRNSATTFTIGNIAYILTGITDTGRTNDLWQYDPTNDQWTKKASFIGAPRSNAMAFSIDNFGYIGGGTNGKNLSTPFADFYRYDPAADKWDSIGTMGGGPRSSGVGFSLPVNGKSFGFIGTGNNGVNNLKDFWQFDPSNKSWTSTGSIQGDKRTEAIAFVINSKAYVGFGWNNNTYINDFYQFDPTITGRSQWTAMAAPASDDNGDGTLDRDLRRYGASVFTISGLGYITLGYYGGFTLGTWAYDPTANTWTQVVNFGGSPRTDGVGFTVNNRGYIATGKYGSQNFSDLWEFIP